MADYYPLLARALEALPNSSPAMRKAVYDRARHALTAQLRSLDPPVSETDIGVELKALDTAIKRLEIDFGAPPPLPAAQPAVPVTPPAPQPPVQKPVAEEPKPLPEPAPMPSAVPLSTQPAIEPPPPPARAEAKPEPEPVPTLAPSKPELKSRAEFVAFVPPPRKKPGSVPAPGTEIEPAIVPEASNANTESAIPLASTTDPGAARRPKIEVVAPRASKSRALRNAFVGGMLAIVIGAIAVAAFLLRDEPSILPQGADGEGPNQAEQSEQKFGDRVDGPRNESAARAPVTVVAPPEVTVAQRGILYEENTSNPQAEPRATGGRVIWRLEPVNGEQGQPLQNAVRMTADFADVGVTLRMTIRKNLDATLPASHTVELDFTMSGPSASQVVQDIGLLQFKDDQNGRGMTISGLPVRVRDNLFLIGLSNLPSDIDRNRDLMLQRSWIDLGFKFRSGQRGVIGVEKGTSGSQALQAAFDLWRD